MRKLFVSISVFVFFLAGSAGFGQTLGRKPEAGNTRPPLSMNEFSRLFGSPIRVTHLAFNKLSASTKAAVQDAANSSPIFIRSIPHFSSSFTFQNQRFPFTMVGHSPQAGGTTRINTSYLALSFVFDEFVDQNGNNVFIDAAGNTKNLLNGPDFESFPYTTGNTQFSDAVQRAEFFNIVKKDNDNDSWHTLLNNPRQADAGHN